MPNRDTDHTHPDREPIDPGGTSLDDLRAVQRAAWETGYATGQIDGEAKERKRIAGILSRYKGSHARISAVLAAIRSGEAAP